MCPIKLSYLHVLSKLASGKLTLEKYVEIIMQLNKNYVKNKLSDLYLI